MLKLMQTLVLMALALGAGLAHAEGMGVMVGDPWIREAPPTAPALGGFMVLRNHTGKPVVLVGAACDEVGEVQLHRTVAEGGMMKMVEQKSVTIPANGELAFKPGDYHIMLMQPKKPFKAGDKVEVTLKFEDGSTMPVNFEVRAMAGGMPMGHDMGGMRH